MVTIRFEDLWEAFEFVGSAPPMEHEAYIALDTGDIHYWSAQTGAFDDSDLPSDLETSDRYLVIPHRTDLGLGSRLALRFAEEHLPQLHGAVATLFRGPGAYARFKDLLAAEGCLEQWYSFEETASRRALKEWCDENGVTVAEESGSA